MSKARFWGIYFVCICCGEFKWRMGGREYCREDFDFYSKKNESKDYTLVSHSLDNIMCWSCQFEKRKQDPLFNPPEPLKQNILDPDNCMLGKEWAEDFNELLLNAVLDV